MKMQLDNILWFQVNIQISHDSLIFQCFDIKVSVAVTGPEQEKQVGVDT